ncbi:MAG: HAD family phosphatase [Clostridia bacterium]|nr:HAD family phosphatase [Clostridia bacterium]
MEYKLIAFDIDDTLLPENKHLSRENMYAIEKALSAGVFVTLATGRGYLGSKPIAEALNIDGPMINYGGAMINDAKTGRNMHAEYIDWSIAREIMEFAREQGVHAHIYQGDGLVYAHESEYPVSYAKKLKIPSSFDEEMHTKEWSHIPKVLIMTDEKGVERIYPLARERFFGRVEIALSSPGFIEFNRLGVNKGSALARLSDMLKISRDQVIAVGDNTLDLEMIEWAGLGVAVSNAADCVKEAAKVVGPSSKESAAFWVIDRFVFGGMLGL